ncbi:MAG: hypothetical protein CFE32_05770 [Alphaproteobacteria bacterium PA3]|nr:MAG: hypothetical protein CFE32_05770 [Alphaproteobacteria bacterium PA3]
MSYNFVPPSHDTLSLVQECADLSWQLENDWRPLSDSEIAMLLGCSTKSIERLAFRGTLLSSISLEYADGLFLGFFVYRDCLDAKIRLCLERLIPCVYCARAIAEKFIGMLDGGPNWHDDILDSAYYSGPTATKINQEFNRIVHEMWTKFSVVREQADLRSLTPFAFHHPKAVFPEIRSGQPFTSADCISCRKTSVNRSWMA